MAPPSATAAPTAIARSSVRAKWIDGSRRDLVLYIATPLLLIPLILLRNGRPAVQDLLLYVGGFGALGHHLPGMMRAYGDRALFRRFRVRFLLAPLLLVPVCIFFSVRELSGVLLVTFLWTNWHSLMQIFGFARIYDAKVSSSHTPGTASPWTSRLDHALCVAWIGAPLLLSDSRLGSVLEVWYRGGGPMIPPGWIAAMRSGWWIAMAVITAAWAVHTVVVWRRGQAPNPAKLALFASSFVFWWFCMAMVDNLLIGIALFDIVHDVQYLALVWTFNRSRVASDPKVGGFSRFLFRGRVTLAGVYVGMVVAYGSMSYLSESITEDLIRQSLLGVLAASALLHFYFDGFIWKVREQSTREALSMAGGGEDIRLGGRLPGWAVHGSKWLLFVIPLGAMYWWEVNDTRDEREWREAIVATVPESAEALTSLASSLDPRREPDEILAMHRRAIEMKPTHPVAHNNFGTALFFTGRIDEARSAFLEAVRLYPRYSVAHRHLGTLLVTTGEVELAAEHFRTAIEHDPRDGAAYAGLGALADGRGEAAQAVALYARALSFKPDERTALAGLAWSLATHIDASIRDGERAVEVAEKLVQLSGRADPLVLDIAAAAYAEAGRIDEALSTILEAIARTSEGGRPDAVAALERRLHRYELGEAWRGPR